MLLSVELKLLNVIVHANLSLFILLNLNCGGAFHSHLQRIETVMRLPFPIPYGKFKFHSSRPLLHLNHSVVQLTIDDES